MYFFLIFSHWLAKKKTLLILLCSLFPRGASTTDERFVPTLGRGKAIFVLYTLSKSKIREKGRLCPNGVLAGLGFQIFSVVAYMPFFFLFFFFFFFFFFWFWENDVPPPPLCFFLHPQGIPLAFFFGVRDTMFVDLSLAG